jgi:hypothetical protein
VRDDDSGGAEASLVLFRNKLCVLHLILFAINLRASWSVLMRVNVMGGMKCLLDWKCQSGIDRLPVHDGVRDSTVLCNSKPIAICNLYLNFLLISML